jgi:hypothetical protein
MVEPIISKTLSHDTEVYLDPDFQRFAVLGRLPFGNKYYILCAEWFSQWKIGKWAAGPISNESLVDERECLRLNLKVGQDYLVINEAQWNFLSAFSGS